MLLFAIQLTSLTRQFAHRSFTNDKDSPIHWSLTWPENTYAIAGDEVEGVLTVANRLPVEVEVSSVLAEFSFEGKVEHSTLTKIPPRSTVQVKLSVPVPSNLASRRSSVETPLGMGRQEVVEKVHTSGLTRAGGGKYEEGGGEEEHVMGGIVVRCTSCTFKIGSVSVGVTSDEPVINDSRDPSDYLAHAWTPLEPPGVVKGPKVLRVHGPLAKINVERVGGGTVAGDGAVFRAVIKVSAGQDEVCKDLGMEMTCVNTFRSSEDTTIKKEGRRALIVEHSPGSSTSSNSSLPADWIPVGNDGSGTEKAVPVKDLNPGDFTYVAVHLYRPPPKQPTVLGEADVDKCRTEYSLVFNYKQSLNGSGFKQVRKRFQGSVEWSEVLGVSLSVGVGGKGLMKGAVWPGNRAVEGERGKWESKAEGSGDACVASGGEVTIRANIKSMVRGGEGVLEEVR